MEDIPKPYSGSVVNGGGQIGQQGSGEGGKRRENVLVRKEWPHLIRGGGKEGLGTKTKIYCTCRRVAGEGGQSKRVVS